MLSEFLTAIHILENMAKNSHVTHPLVLLSVMLALFNMTSVSKSLKAQLPLDCYQRPTYRDNPWTDGSRYCLELVVDAPDFDSLGFTALATGDNALLYAALPLRGEVVAFADTDSDQLPDTPQLVIEGLTLPTGLAYHDGALYIATGSQILRLVDNDLTTLVDDLPSGSAFWTSGLTIGEDQRIYVGIGAPCDTCLNQDGDYGAILSFDLNGDNQRVEATGLRHPAALVHFDDSLWTVDTARDGLAHEPQLDELNVLPTGSDPVNFGFPVCIGGDNHPDLPGEFDCARAANPALTFPTHSTPVGLAAYTTDTLPDLKDTLLVVLNGSNNQAHMQGYALAAVTFDAAGNPNGYNLLIPGQRESDEELFSLQHMNYRTSGFWPRRPFAVAVSSQGWIYVSVSGGRIYALRPL